MGEVYRAEDTKLGREVAIKVLPEAVASDPERLARFEREAKVLASLNHPHIAAIYSIESATLLGQPMARLAPQEEVEAALDEPPASQAVQVEAGDRGAERQHPPVERSDQPVRPIHFLVMELAEGEDLAARIARGPVPVEEAIGIALRIAEALEAPHEKGIIHRDLKPANVKVSPEGKVKVLDFGLAKALDPPTPNAGEPLAGSREGTSPSPTNYGAIPSPSMSPTLTAQMTGAGVLLGTAAYMSPEQARGQEAGKQADIWAFGVVFWEMLCGQRLFAGPTVSDTLAEVLKTEPDLGALPEGVPPAVHRLLRRCLERDPRKRLRDIGDARLELDEASEVEGQVVQANESTTDTKARHPLAWIAGAALLALLIGFGAGWLGKPAGAPSAGPLHVSVNLPEGTRLTLHGNPLVALSPDGTKVAYVAQSDEGQFLYVQDLGTGAVQIIEGSDDAEGPFFSPDGGWVAFAAGSVSGPSKLPAQLRKASLETGIAQTLTLVADYFGGTWAEDDSIYFAGEMGAGLWRVDAAGGEPTPIAAPESPEARQQQRTLAWPEMLPGGRNLLTITWEGNPLGKILLVDVATGAVQDLGIHALTVRYVETGHILFVSTDGTLSAIPFDIDQGTVTGSPVALRQSISIGSPPGGVLAVSRSGALLFTEDPIQGSGRLPSQLVRIRPNGTLENLPFEPSDLVRDMSLSPDSERLVVGDSEGSLWIYDLERETRSKLPQGDISAQMSPTWSPDGAVVVSVGISEETGWQYGLFVQPADGSGPPELLHAEGGEQWPESFIPETGELIFRDWQGDRPIQILRTIALEPGSEPRTLLQQEGVDIIRSAISPDGQWMSHTGTLDEVGEVMIRPYPELDSPIQVSAGGGNHAKWDPSQPGRLYYWGNAGGQRTLMEVDIDEQGDLSVVRPIIDPTRLARYTLSWQYVVAGDGSIIARLSDPDSGIVTQLDLVLDWTSDLAERVPSDN